MTRAIVNAHCGALPGAVVSDPWGGGHDCWKVADKIFANVGARDLGVSFKCENAGQAAMLIEIGVVERAPYMPRGGWVMARWGALADEELRARLTASYLTVRRALPKRAQAALGPEPA